MILFHQTPVEPTGRWYADNSKYLYLEVSYPVKDRYLWFFSRQRTVTEFVPDYSIHEVFGCE